MENKELDYHEQRKKNEAAFKDALKKVRPDIWLLMDTIDETGVNPFVLWKVIFALNNINTATGYGNVTVEVEDRVVRFVRGQSNDKVNEPLIKTLDNNKDTNLT